MKVDIYMPWFVMDYLRDTSDMTAAEHGAYLLLLAHMWGRGGVLPNDPVRLARLAATEDLAWPGVWATIGRFFTPCDGGITQGRLVRELGAARGRRESAKANGFKGGRPPNNRPVSIGLTGMKPDANRAANRNETSSSSSSSSSSTSKSKTARQARPPVFGVLIKQFTVAWQDSYGEPYAITGSDTRQLGATLKAVRGFPDDVVAAWVESWPAKVRAFMADRSQWLVEQRHPLRTFATQVNSYGDKKRADGKFKSNEDAARAWAGGET